MFGLMNFRGVLLGMVSNLESISKCPMSKCPKSIYKRCLASTLTLFEDVPKMNSCVVFFKKHFPEISRAFSLSYTVGLRLLLNDNGVASTSNYG